VFPVAIRSQKASSCKIFIEPLKYRIVAVFVVCFQIFTEKLLAVLQYFTVVFNLSCKLFNVSHSFFMTCCGACVMLHVMSQKN